MVNVDAAQTNLLIIQYQYMILFVDDLVVCMNPLCTHLDVSLEAVFQLLSRWIVGEESESREMAVPHAECSGQ